MCVQAELKDVHTLLNKIVPYLQPIDNWKLALDKSTSKGLAMIKSATEKLGINLGSKVQSVLETLNKGPARIGDEGNLGEHCPAPEDWNQEDYVKFNLSGLCGLRFAISETPTVASARISLHLP